MRRSKTCLYWRGLPLIGRFLLSSANPAYRAGSLSPRQESLVTIRSQGTRCRLETVKPNAASRLSRQLLTNIHTHVLPNAGFVLWDGSTVPAKLGPDALAFVIADEGVAAALIRRPSLDTFVNLWVTSRIDLRNGSLLDLPASFPRSASRRSPSRSTNVLCCRQLRVSYSYRGVGHGR